MTLIMAPFGSIEFLRTQFLKADGPPNVVVFVVVLETEFFKNSLVSQP
jgi:hypothetical protein